MIESLVSQQAEINESDIELCSVLIVDDDEISALAVSDMLAEIANTEFLCDSTLVLKKCIAMKPDLVLLDVNMPTKNGLEVCKEIKSARETEDIPIMFLTSSLEHDVQKACWEAGAIDFTVKPILAMTLKHRVKNILLNGMRIKFLSKISFRDPLTGLYNRHFLNTEVSAAFKSASRNMHSFGVIVLDIDFFKGFNDSYGHLAGDSCLLNVAQVIKKSLHRPSDMVIRFGGEEFIVALPETDKKGVLLVANRILKNVEALKIEHVGSPNRRVTVSAGYSVTKATASASLESIINLADLALFEAKQSGRNTVCGFENFEAAFK
ncbi:diguanylate cyclase [Alteromonas sp. KUL106]|uniref:GGDEF domain-containing response regulator n=1 Tax=Alteromonas sp. KUL106 TaxID=2480799 RepID=UPI0012E5B8B6|nr:diguanylate cyclase [Alteromonas sp. KUL106]GFD68582.1 diguanylate cyclase response regulator [Alteromonas sp. KUL106]